MSVIDTLIFDRTQNDVESRTKKGHYNSDDLNRVINAVNYLADIFYQFGYSPGVTPQTTDWTADKIPEDAQMRVYLANVRALRETLATLPTTPPCPASMNGWTWESANDLEQILADLEVVLTALSKTKVRCAQTVLFCGNVYYMREPERALVDRTGAMVRTRDGRGIILRQN